MPTSRTVEEGGLFFRRWLQSPRAMGSVWPSSRALGRAVAEAAALRPDDRVVELGGGTGAITRALLEGGVAPERVTVVELDPNLADYLERHFPGCRVVRGDASRLGALARGLGSGPVGAVISGLPMLPMPFEFQRAVIHGALGILRPGGALLQYTYSPLPPVPTRRLGVRARLVRLVLLNLPPATVWRFERDRSAVG